MLNRDEREEAIGGRTGCIIDIETTLVDLPFVRLQRFARFETRTQSTLMIRIRDSLGQEGIGETVVPGGPWWSGDSIESLKSLIDIHLAPAVIGLDPSKISVILMVLQKTAPGANFAIAGIEMACLDLYARALDVPVSSLFGGQLHEEIPTVWPLASGNHETDLTEIGEKLETGKSSGFKIKLGRLSLEEDIDRVALLTDAIAGRGRVILDPNEVWDETQAHHALVRLGRLSIDLIEQPVSRYQPEALAALSRSTPVPLMVDEGACTPEQVFRLAKMRAAQVLSLKLMKAGGLTQSRKMADIASAAGMLLYMGTFLETSLGTAAGLHIASTFPHLRFGSELFGPQLLAVDVTQSPIEYVNGCARVPAGPGLGVSIDEDVVREYKRR
ncbi:MAG: chloromuconate cycloisomerase [Rhizobiaceae bacterium MnEN-MB40S]|nr:MAG: chloromuconate cycloisomerase [Rhizobiaceae bacterium MnEN-MB40S]